MNTKLGCVKTPFLRFTPVTDNCDRGKSFYLGIMTYPHSQGIDILAGTTF